MKSARIKEKTVLLKIQLQPKCHKWLETLVDTGRYGNSKQAVAIGLLGYQFTALMKSGELPTELPPLSELADFPGTKNANPGSKETAGE
jgi:hypothetical protein